MSGPGPRGSRQRHFVDVWNPSYAADSMDAHLTVLIDAARRFERKEVVEDALHVWWGKVRSPHRQQELKHLPAVREIAAELETDPDRECHLYLTDYTSLYVGHVDEISMSDVRDSPEAQAPGYYRELGLACDFWYRLLDIRRLATDTRAVIAELKALRNPGYSDMPVSLYGGMVDLPLVVYRRGRAALLRRRQPRRRHRRSALGGGGRRGGGRRCDRAGAAREPVRRGGAGPRSTRPRGRSSRARRRCFGTSGRTRRSTTGP